MPNPFLKALSRTKSGGCFPHQTVRGCFPHTPVRKGCFPAPARRGRPTVSRRRVDLLGARSKKEAVDMSGWR